LCVVEDTMNLSAGGIDTGKNIRVTEGLVEGLKKRQLWACLFHELGHHIHNDILYGILKDTVRFHLFDVDIRI